MNKIDKIALQIREGKIDINNQSSFFSILIKGLLLKLDKEISIRKKSIPHFILQTGDDTMYLNIKGYNSAIEPLEISNENYIYNQIPRCIINPGNINLLPDQLTNPYSFGQLQYESEDGIYNFTGEFRRMPFKLSCDIKYYVDTYSDLLELMQQIITKLSFIKTYKITYLGQIIECSYNIPENMEGEYPMDIDGTTTDSKLKTMSLNLEIESNIPIYSPQTIMPSDKIINHPILKLN